MMYHLRSRVWLYPGPAAWYFVSLSKKAAKEIKNDFGHYARGFGSLPVTVTVGKTSWKTSIFPDSKSGVYILPLKAAVRHKEDIIEGDMLLYTIEI